MHRGYGFVEFETHEEADKARLSMDEGPYTHA